MLQTPSPRLPLSLTKSALFALFALGCSPSAGGPEYLDVRVSAVEDGSTEPQTFCVPVPVMPGGRTSRERSFANAFTTKIDASRDRIIIVFLGILRPELFNADIGAAELADDSYTDSDLRVETPGGRRFTVDIAVGPRGGQCGEPDE
jgi:hypothetical protein